MKKLFPYILIVLIVAQLLAPFTVGVGTKNNLEVKSNKAEAGWLLNGVGTDPITLDIQPSVKDTAIKITVGVNWPNKDLLSAESVYVMRISQTQGGEKVVEKVEKVSFSPLGATIQTGSVEFPGLTPGTTYKFDIIGTQNTTTLVQSSINLFNTIFYFLLPGNYTPTPLQNNGEVKNSTPYEITTLTTPTTTYQEQKIDNATMANDASILPVCAFNNIGGCVGIILYRLVFQPSSRIFAITGKLLDYTLFYSIQDTSYRSQFVVEGWGMVRDFVNMFFIFVLLYIAFGTILKLNGVKTKEMIINIVIIGLLINFSLFATQVIIDASNILTRVFYNQILVGPKVKGVVVEELGLGGSKQLTAALVAKINPQKIILNAGKAGEIPTKGLNSTGDNSGGNPSGVDNGTFIMVTIMASILNIVGLWTFLMVSMIFIARVVGLWLAMILVPIAFFSYTIPQMQDMDMIGWKKWWPETLKLAFLAPVFIFFLYLIIQFLDSGLGVMDADGKSGLDFFIAIIVPFAFLMILLIKAKDITMKMSGKIGDTITNIAKTAGGIALGGAAIGGAVFGRRIIGQTMAKASRGETSTQRYSEAEKLKAAGDSTAWKKLSWQQKTKGFVGKYATLGVLNEAYGDVKIDYDKMKRTGEVGGLGGLLNKAQKKTQETDFARHTTDEAVDKAGFKGKTMNELGAEQQERVKKIFVRDNKSKWAQEEEDTYKGELGKSDRDKLSPEEVTELRSRVIARAEKEFATEVEKAAKGVNAFARVLAKANTGSWDVRKLSSVTSDKRASVFSKIPVALIGAVAMGVRGGLKSVGTSHGSIKIEGNFMKDLGNTISDSLKGMKVNVNLEHVGETKSSADAHGGGGGTHH